MKVEGFNTRRHSTNPKEKELHDLMSKKFNKEFSHNSMDRLVFGVKKDGDTPRDYLTDREKRIVLSTVQWLGSPVGKGILREVGFIEKK